jgi:hypothetical protein
VYFNIRNTLPKSGTFLLGHPVYMFYLFNVITHDEAPSNPRMSSYVLLRRNGFVAFRTAEWEVKITWSVKIKIIYA